MNKKKILIALNAFKQNGTSLAFGKSLATGIKSQGNSFDVKFIPLSDGGDGMLDLVATVQDGSYKKIASKDAYFYDSKAEVYLDRKSDTAYIDLAKIIGFKVSNNGEFLNSSSYGAGIVSKKLIEDGYKNIILGVGGLISIDLGLGFLNALGLTTLDEKKLPIICTTGNLDQIKSIQTNNLDTFLLSNEVKFTLLCDAEAYIAGSDGCWVRTVQKGGTTEDVDKIKKAVLKVTKLIYKMTGVNIENKKYLGCGGGFAGGLFALTNAKVELGAEYLMDIIKIDKLIKNCDLVITGEGIVDHTTIIGKAPYRLMLRAKKYNKPTLLMSSQCNLSYEEITQNGFAGYIRTEIGKLYSFPYKNNEGNKAIELAGRNLASILTIFSN